MKVLFITRKYPPQVGGMEKLSYNLINTFPLRSGEEKFVIKLNKNQKHLWWFMPYALFKSILIAPKVDIIHLGDPVLSIVGWFLKKIYHKPVAVTIHGLDITYKNFIYQFYLKLFAFSFDKYICISRLTQLEAKKRGFGRTVIIPVGVEIKSKTSRPLRLGDIYLDDKILRYKDQKIFNPFILITVGRLVRRKGVYWFVKNVMPDLIRLCPRVCYLVAGSGRESQRLKRLINKLGVSQKVVLLGQLSDEDLTRLYSHSSLFVMPNIKVRGDLEGFGIVAIEAGQFGLPLIARAIEGIIDAVIDGKDGTLIKDLSLRAWLEKIEELYHNPTLARQEGERNRLYVLENFSYQKITEKYYQVFSILLKQLK